MIGTIKLSSFSAKPDGLSLCSVSVPYCVSGSSKLRFAVKSTKSSVVQSLWALAVVDPISVPFSSLRVIGNSASKNQVPRAFPVIVSGLEIVAVGRGESITIMSIFSSSFPIY